MRLQVYLSHNGVCSRREALGFIQSGRVKVNGHVIKEPSTPVSGSEEITVDGQKIAAKEYTCVMLNKPAGYTTTKEDIHAEKTVMDLLPSSMRIWRL
jgi:23S rRNA pseudouridine2605 synthase